jgi:hypothetical protein
MLHDVEKAHPRDDLRRHSGAARRTPPPPVTETVLPGSFSRLEGASSPVRPLAGDCSEPTLRSLKSQSASAIGPGNRGAQSLEPPSTWIVSPVIHWASRSAKALARPMPREAPVTRAVFAESVVMTGRCGRAAP